MLSNAKPPAPSKKKVTVTSTPKKHDSTRDKKSSTSNNVRGKNYIIIKIK